MIGVDIYYKPRFPVLGKERSRAKQVQRVIILGF